MLRRLLPPTTGLETDHYDISFHALAVRNTTKYSPALFAPAAGTKHVHASPSSTTRLPALRSPSRTSPSRSRPVRWRCDAARVSSCAVRGVVSGCAFMTRNALATTSNGVLTFAR